MITSQDIDKLAALARIKIDANEKNQLVSEIDAILAYVDTIKKATAADAKLQNAADFAVRNVMRPDEVATVPETVRQALLSALPEREGDFLVVKKIIAQD